jgi:drug/metabolite transporter (DMT)-like permease
MSTRSRKTLMVAARFLIVAACLVLLWKSRGASWSGILPWACGLAVIWAALTSYTWFYGNPDRESEMLARREERRASRTVGR